MGARDARARLLLTDLPVVVPRLRANALANGFAEGGGEDAPVCPGDLRRSPNLHALRHGIPFRDKAARFHEHGGVALHAERLLQDQVSLGESRICIAAHGRPDERPVAAMRLEEDARRLLRAGAIGNGGKGLNLEVNQVERIFSYGCRVGHDDRHRLADIAHLFEGEHRLMKGREFREWLEAQGYQRRRCPKVARGDDGPHARKGAGPGDVDPHDPPMSLGTAEHHRMKLVGS